MRMYLSRGIGNVKEKVCLHITMQEIEYQVQENAWSANSQLNSMKRIGTYNWVTYYTYKIRGAPNSSPILLRGPAPKKRPILNFRLKNRIGRFLSHK